MTTGSFKPFSEMKPEDYASIGLRSGLEVHQQLLTEKKLFCRCPAGRYSDQYDCEILRHMRPTLSELGEYDGTALMEKKTRKNIHYRIHHETVCTYEFDDTPPFLMNEQALGIALEIGLLLRLNLVNELHVARKQYLDGSIPTGFQRTTIIGVDGWLPYQGRRIGIRQLGLEEDACREVSDNGHDRVYLTDRLGMPLVEPVTEPDMRTPQEVADVCQIIRKLCRATGKVRTGYGTARQDVNVSITGGTRVEIKGVPQIWRIPRLVYNEARRQWSLLRVRDELKSRGITEDTLQYSKHDVTRALAQTVFDPVRSAVAAGMRVKCAVLRGFAGILNMPTQEHTTLAKEFSDRVRVIACLTKLPNMVHSDTASESLAARDWKAVAKRTKAGDRDVMILVWGDERDTQCACEEIILRAREAAVGVPNDTRQALKDGTNGFERVLPGAERMYPDTDLPPQAIDPEGVERIRRRLPEYPWDREKRYRDMSVPADCVTPLSQSKWAGLFERVVKELQVDATFAAVVLCQRFKAFRRAGLAVKELSEDHVYEVFKAYADGRLACEGVRVVLRHLLVRDPQAESKTIPEVLEELGLTPVPADQVHGLVTDATQGLDDDGFPTTDHKHRFVMGNLMGNLLGRCAGTTLAKELDAEIGAD